MDLTPAREIKKERLFKNTSEDIVELPYFFQFGNINDELLSEERKSIISLDLLDIDYEKKTDRCYEEAAQMWHTYWTRFTEYIEKGNKVRIWVRDNAESLCGLGFICDYLKSFENEVVVVHVQEEYEGLVPTKEELLDGLKKSGLLTEQKKQKYAAKWDMLKKDSGSIRLLREGNLVSKGETEFDYIIDSILGDKSRRWDEVKRNFAENYYDLSRWLSFRLHKLIDEGFIAIIEQADNGIVIQKQKEYVVAENRKEKLAMMYEDMFRAQLKVGFSETLLKLIAETKMSEAEVYNNAFIDRRHFSKIRNDVNYMPSKKTVLLLAVAMHLTMEQTYILLETAGYTFSSSLKSDLIIKDFFEKGNYDLFQINKALSACGLIGLT